MAAEIAAPGVCRRRSDAIQEGQGTGLGQLSGAREESRALADRLRGFADTVTLRESDMATEDDYRRVARGADMLHLACHAILGRTAAESSLYLAPDEHGDGQLTAADIPETRLNDALVVLSACDTAQGRPTADGIVGLARSYFLAGAHAVIASSWKVPDLVTRVLMGHLYDGLLAAHGPRLNLTSALRQAALQTREDLRAGRIVDADGRTLDDRVANWGPFVAIGECTFLRFEDPSNKKAARVR